MFFSRKLLTVLLVALIVIAGVFAQSTVEVQQGRSSGTIEASKNVELEVSSLEPNVFTTKYGNLYTTLSAEDFIDEFTWGDLLKVSFLGQTLELPVVPTYSYVDSGIPAVIVNKNDDGKPTGYVSFAINMGNFTETYGIAKKTTNEDKTWFWTANEGVVFPLTITVSLKEKGGYLSQYILHDLSRTNAREDYAALSDEQFANFRQIRTTGMGNNLYRTSSPINNEIGRAPYADAAIANAGVTVIVNLADDKASAEGYNGFSDTYYSKQNVLYLCLGVDFNDANFKKGLAEGIGFMASNPGIYAVHCTEGKDRAGFISALLECLMEATPEEVVNDYMLSYYNYYGVEKGSDKYKAIADSNIIKTLRNAFGLAPGVDFYSFTGSDLHAGAVRYLLDIGVSEAEILKLKANLAR